MAAAQYVGEKFLSALFDKLIDKLASEFMDLFRGKEAIVKLLTELKTTLFSAGLLLDDAEKKLIKDPRVKEWLVKLKETVYDADDLIYKIDTRALRNELEGDQSQSSSSSSSFTSKILKLFPISFTSAFDKAIKSELEEIIGDLKSLLEQKNSLGLENVETQTQLLERLPAPTVDEYEVYGRSVDKEAIIKLMLSDDASGDNLSVIPIVGMGGIGKTTLAQLVFNDERVNERFDTKVWVTVGEDKVDCFKVMKEIIKQVTNSDKCEVQEQYVLQNKLKKSLTGKRFLIVLDDIWDEDPRKWDVLKGSFGSGLRGSTTVVTTRSTKVACVMETGSIHQLDRISDDDGWRLFAKHASIDVNYSNEYLDLHIIGRKIVDKCKGLPLAIKSLGDLLRCKRNKNEWVNVLNSDIWELNERNRIGILPALWLSYYYLPSELKACFAYCALFPKDYAFKKEELILLWMAEDLLHFTTRKRMEEYGEEYFQDLVSRSFFQPSGKEFVMHDLLHDLAIYVFGNFFLEMDDTNFSKCTHKIRYLSYRGSARDPKKFEALSKAKGLRTFLSHRPWSLHMDHLLEPLLHAGSCLRVLALCDYNVTKLPDSIGDLKYLRYLELDYCTELKTIPETICNLYNLKTLLLRHCIRLTRLPTNIGNLSNLQHLLLPPTLEELPLQIGKLTGLQTLNTFIVGEKNMSGGLKQLKELQNLHGTLHIWGLENVAGVEDGLEAVLKDKKFLTDLSLSWKEYADYLQKEKDVLDALEPHATLMELSISYYPGTSFPNWVGDQLFSNIVKVTLYKCRNCSVLPPLGQLSSLKDLRIVGFLGVKEINSEFYYASGGSPAAGIKPFRSLESLRFEDLSKLKKWSFMEGKVEGGVFPCLKELRLRWCMRLKSLPGYFPSLRLLDIEDCEQILPLLPRGQQMDVAFPSLKTLNIFSADGEELLVEGGLPTSLKEVRLKSCHNLTTLDEEAFQCLTSLEKLDISHCFNIRCLPRGLPTSLSDLSIKYCDLLTPRLHRETGVDWPIIAHVPSINISGDGYSYTTDERNLRL